VQISIVIPVNNEADNIRPLINEIVSVFSVLKVSATYEIIIVDDGSSDQTPQILSKAINEVSALRVIQHEISCGQSTAVSLGIKFAKYPVIATLDGDGQNDPADIPRLYDVLIQQGKANAKLWMVAGWRNKRHDSSWKLISSKIANTVRSGLLSDNTPDTGCGLKVFLRDKFLELPYFDHMHRFLPALIIRAGGQVISEPVNHRARTQGYSKYGTLDRLWAGIIDIMGVIWLKKRAKFPIAKELPRE
jgi:dolichol-phosphate mannosyltransferase